MSQPALPKLTGMPSTAARTAARIRDAGLLPVWAVTVALWRAVDGDQTEAMWMSREGLAVLDGAPLVHLDRWGWATQPWDFIPTSPGWELLTASLWRAFGANGFAILSFLVTAATLGVLAWLSRTLGATPTATALAVGFTGVLASSVLTSRAGAPAFTLLLLQLLIFWHLRLRLGRSAPIAAVALVISLGFGTAYLGIWLHGSWTLFAVVSAGAQGILYLSPDYGLRRKRIALFAAGAMATLAATVCGPLGVSAWSNTWRVASVCRGLIKEWTTPWQLGSLWPSMWVFMAAVLALGIIRDGRRGTRAELNPLKVVVLLLATGAVLAGVTAVRFLLLGILASTPLIAGWLSIAPRWLDRGQWRRRLGERAHEPYWRNIVAMLMLFTLPIALLSALQFQLTVNPAVAKLPAACSLFSSDFDAKSVEYWRRDVRVWVDGRQDYWGRERLIATQQLLRSKRPEQLVPAGTSCVLLETGRFDKLIARMEASPQWQRVERNDQLSLWIPRT